MTKIIPLPRYPASRVHLARPRGTREPGIAKACPKTPQASLLPTLVQLLSASLGVVAELRIRCNICPKPPLCTPRGRDLPTETPLATMLIMSPGWESSRWETQRILIFKAQVRII